MTKQLNKTAAQIAADLRREAEQLLKIANTLDPPKLPKRHRKRDYKSEWARRKKRREQQQQQAQATETG